MCKQGCEEQRMCKEMQLGRARDDVHLCNIHPV